MSDAHRGAKASKRMTLVFPERTAERLARLQELTDASSATEVIRNALLVYEVIAEAASDGGRLMQRTRDGRLEVLPITIDVEAGANHPDEGEPAAAAERPADAA
jgi:hypothetical protein